MIEIIVKCIDCSEKLVRENYDLDETVNIEVSACPECLERARNEVRAELEG